jgi:hypothetical protein
MFQPKLATTARLIWAVWLLVLSSFAAFGSQNPCFIVPSRTEWPPCALAGYDYDGHAPACFLYDGSAGVCPRYDRAEMHTADECAGQTVNTRPLFAFFAKFLAAEGGIPNFIYRTGSQTENALTDAAGVSFRDSISSSANRAQVFDPGAKIWAVDTSKLPSGSVVLDGNPAGHVSVLATPSEIQAAIVPQSPANPLSDFGLKLLEDGTSYRIPKK